MTFFQLIPTILIYYRIKILNDHILLLTYCMFYLFPIQLFDKSDWRFWNFWYFDNWLLWTNFWLGKPNMQEFLQMHTFNWLFILFILLYNTDPKGIWGILIIYVVYVDPVLNPKKVLIFPSNYALIYISGIWFYLPLFNYFYDCF